MTVTIKKKVTNDIELVHYHTWRPVHGKPGRYESARRVAFVKKGSKWLKVLAIDATAKGGLRVWKEPVSELRYMKPILRKGKPYSITRALRVFHRFAKAQGITKGAKKLLKEVSKQ